MKLIWYMKKLAFQISKGKDRLLNKLCWANWLLFKKAETFQSKVTI